MPLAGDVLQAGETPVHLTVCARPVDDQMVSVDPANVADATTTPVFRFVVTSEGRVRVRFDGRRCPGGEAVVLIEVDYLSGVDHPPALRRFTFDGVADARHFVEESVMALEHLGGIVTEPVRVPRLRGPG